jgi:uncharacterized protein (DUF2267 family)
MDFDQFTGQVQHRLELPSTGRSLRAIRATLTTLGERLQEGEATDLAGALPMEIDRYLVEVDSGQRFDFDEFVTRVLEREELTDPDDRGDAVYHAKAIMQVVAETIPPGELAQVRGQLPDDFDPLFDLVEQDQEPT